MGPAPCKPPCLSYRNRAQKSSEIFACQGSASCCKWPISSQGLSPWLDLDYPATNRKKRDSRLDAGLPLPTCKQYPRLREALALYMMAGPGDEKVYPKARHVVDVLEAAAGATEDEILRCLSYLREERGLKPGTRTGPRQFSWFPTAIADCFQRQRAREQPAAAAAAMDCKLSGKPFDSMTAANNVVGR